MLFNKYLQFVTRIDKQNGFVHLFLKIRIEWAEIAYVFPLLEEQRNV